MPRFARNLLDYLSQPATVLPEREAIESFVQNIQRRHELGGSTSSRYFGDAAGQNLYAVSVYPDRTALVPGRNIPSALLRTFIQANHTLLPERAEAILLALRYNQIAVYDLAESMEILTGGTGEELGELPPVAERLAFLKRRKQKKSNERNN